jgi:hypothetical protein
MFSDVSGRCREKAGLFAGYPGIKMIRKKFQDLDV